MPAQTVIQPRRGSAASWTTTNPILAIGEIGLESDTLKTKMGDGSTAWNSLPYEGADKAAVGHTHTVSQLTDATTIGKEILLDATAADVRATIGAGTSNLVIGTTGTTAMAGNKTFNFSEILGTIATAQLPPIAITNVYPVANQAAMLALTAERGDMALRADNGESYILSTDSPSTLADWLMITAPGNVTSVAGRQGAVVLTKADVGLSNVDNTSDANKPLSSAMTTALAGKEAAFAAGTTSQYRRGDKTWQTLDKTAVGLANVDNTADSAKPLSTAMTTALAGKEASLPAGGLTTHYLRGDKTWVTHDKASVGLANVDNTADSAKPVSTAQATAIAAKENTITAGTTAQYYRGDKTWQTLNAAAVGLANVNNTADSAKPVSTAQQTALDLKANLASPTFTGTPTLPAGTLGLTKSTVGLANVDNTADTAKPVSTAQQTALNGKANVTHTHTSVDILSIDGGTP
ncbi:hydrolase [Arthrobacter phage Qui]|jgi:hypothetical protein|uniref:Minor tail protein n=1 Tax=Arthrobacter phage Qui TaxID=2603260 RepID=A0A5B8WID7_9CAUD|nr:hydrolase [Arthrobacter phage Qui]QED11527.1 minor tail protein [Arthrobacter phage Qui]QOC56359.1 minor tail protein [Arthrobacter phage Paella]